ncbi:unnamed protein product [Closterium sp. Yama58-4]|nr:unnamed protein product [Closterium sp. Yama58-4]
MASLSVLEYDTEGRPIQFDTWLVDRQLYLLSDSRENVSLFDYVSGACSAPPDTADSATRSQWLTRDAAARLAIRNHLPLAERAHFGQHKTAKALYDATVARYSSPATAALGRLILAYLFPELFSFATVEELITHLRTSDALYHAALPAELVTKNEPSIYITLYFIVTRLPDSLRAVRDHFLALDHTDLTIDLLEKHLLAAETSIVASTSLVLRRSVLLLLLVGSAAAARAREARVVGAAAAGGVVVEAVGAVEVTEVAVGVVAGAGASVAATVAATAVVVVLGVVVVVVAAVGVVAEAVAAEGVVAAAMVVVELESVQQQQQQQRQRGTLTPQQLREWYAQRGASGGSARCPYVIRTGDRAGQTCGKFHTQYRCFSRLDDAWRTEYGEKAEMPRWAELLRAGVDIFALDYDAILAGMYAMITSAEGDCYLCMPPDPGIEAAALGASESALSGTAPAEALHTFTLDSACGDLYVLPDWPSPGHVHPSLPSLPPSPAPPCVPCVEGRQRAAPHSSSFPPTTAPLQTLQTDVWGPARVSGQGRERYFLLVVDDYSRYTTVFPLHSKGEVPDVLIPWIRAVRLQLRERFRTNLRVLRLHSDRGGEFSSDLLRDFCRGEGIAQSFTLPASPQQNGVAERRIGLVMDPRVSLPETSPTLHWTGEVGDASVFRVWGSRAFVRDTSADKLSSCAIPCVFLGFPTDAPGWQFYHPTSRRVLSSQDVTFDESVPIYRLFPHLAAPLPPPPLFLAPGPPPVDPLPPQGPAPSGVSQVDPLPLAEPVEVTGDSGAAAGGAAQGAASGGAEPERAEPGGAEPAGAEPGGAEPAGAEPGGAEPRGAASGGAELAGAESRGSEPERTEPGGAEPVCAEPGVLSLRVLCLVVLRLLEVLRVPRRSGLASKSLSHLSSCASVLLGAHVFGVAPLELEALELELLALEELELVTLELEVLTLEVLELEPLELEALVLLALVTLELEVLALEALELEALKLEPLALEELEMVTLELEVLALEALELEPLELEALVPRALCSSDQRREPASRPASPVRRARRVPRPRPPPVPGTHTMALRPSSAPQRVPLPSPPTSSLPNIPDPESDRVRAASPTVTRLLATVVTDPSFESTAASALVAELVDFAAACRLDYAASFVAESESVCPPSVGGECALGTDVLEDRQEDFDCLAAAVPHLVAWLLALEGDPDALDIPTPRSYAEAISDPYSSQWQTAMDAKMASWKSTGTYVDEVPPPGANIVDGMWIFRVKRPPGSSPVFKARYVARGFSQRQRFDFFQTFSPTLKMTTLRVLLHVAAQRDYELHSLDFSTAFLQGSLHEEIWLRRPPGFTGSFPPGTQWSLRRPVYGLRQAPREWHDTLRATLAALGFAPSTADPSLFLRTDTSLPPFYILVYIDDLVFATADTEGLALVKSELQKRHTCTDLGELRSYLGLQITRDRARRTITLTQSHMVQQVLQRFGFQFSSPQSTPLPTGHSLSDPPSDESVEPSGPYPELVGCLMYPMTCTRPDLAYPLSILARYVAPGRHRREHWEAAKRVLRYLCSTSGMGLVLGGRGRVVLTGHSDASWVDDLATQRSSQGYNF